MHNKTPQPKTSTRPDKAFARAGLFAAIAAYTMWGFFPVYFKATAHVPPLEILAHRVLWGLPFCALIISLRQQWSEIGMVLRSKKTLLALVLSALIIGANWGLYVWAIQSNNIFQASLGYYINPIVFILVGVVFLGEKLSRLRGLAIGLAGIGVTLLTVYGGKFPWLALGLALAFTVYGLIRKKVKIGAVPGLFVEMCVLALPTFAYLLFKHHQDGLVFTTTGWEMRGLIMLAGPVTVMPLVAFAFAARRLELSTIGFLQFIGPSLQFIVGILYGEPLTPAILWCFGFIWLAVLVFIWDVAHKYRQEQIEETPPL